MRSKFFQSLFIFIFITAYFTYYESWPFALVMGLTCVVGNFFADKIPGYIVASSGFALFAALFLSAYGTSLWGSLVIRAFLNEHDLILYINDHYHAIDIALSVLTFFLFFIPMAISAKRNEPKVLAYATAAACTYVSMVLVWRDVVYKVQQLFFAPATIPAKEDLCIGGDCFSTIPVCDNCYMIINVLALLTGVTAYFVFYKLFRKKALEKANAQTVTPTPNT